MAYKKIDQVFVLSDSTVNVYGFRLLTTGFLKDEFLKNPIGYYNHVKTDGVLLRWEDVALDGDKVTGRPVINMEHPRAERTIKEIEEGFLNAASVGHICLLDTTMEPNPADPANPTVVGTKWYNKECSLVDSPGNRNAFKAGLYDGHDNELNLSDIRQVFIDKSKKQSEMTKIELPITAALISMLNLSDDSTADAVERGIKELHDGKKKAETDLSDYKTAAEGKEIDQILDKGLSDGKFDKVTRDKLGKQYAGKVADLKDLVDGMKVYQPLVDQLKDGEMPPDLQDKSYDELHQAGKIVMLKDKFPGAYKKVYKEKFGVEPQ